jgi:hypothetical protein
VAEGAVAPDPIALRDDLSHVAEILATASDGPALDYAAQFLRGVASSARDEALGRAAAELRASRTSGTGVQAAIQSVARLIDTRIARAGVV